MAPEPGDPAAGSPPGAPRAAVRTRWALILLLLLGAGLRAGYARERVAAPDFEHPAVDAGFHDAWARALAGIGKPAPELAAFAGRPYLRPPGYPFFLAGIYALSGGSRSVAMLAQMALGLLAGLLAWRIGRRWFSAAEGLLACALVLGHWTLIYFEGELHAPALAIALLLGSLELLGRWWDGGRPRAALAAGLLLGAAAVVRPNTLLCALAAAAWMLARGSVGRRAWLAAPAWLLAGVAAAVAPVTLRNVLVAGEPVLISSNGGVNLYIGNQEHATGIVAAHLPGLGPFETCYDYPRIVERVKKRAGAELTDGEVSAWFARRALEDVRRSPARVLALTWHKARLFWGPREVPHNKDLSLERDHSRVLARLPLPFGWLTGLAAFGVLALLSGLGAGGADEARPGRSARRRAGAWLVGLYVAALFLSVLPFFVASRYRVPEIPLLAVFAAVGPVAAARTLFAAERRGWSRVLAAAAGAALVAGGLAWHAPGGPPNAAKWHLDRARALRRGGDQRAAADEARAALALDPGDEEASFVLGNALGELGDGAGAEACYRRVLDRRPKDYRAWNNLGSVLAERGDLAGAVDAFEHALERDPEPGALHFNLGLVLERSGRPAEARGQFAAALARRPGWPQARRALARVSGGDDGLPTDAGEGNLQR